MKNRILLFAIMVILLLMCLACVFSGFIETNVADKDQISATSDYKIQSILENYDEAMNEAESWNLDAYLTYIFLYVPIGEETGEPILDFSFSSPSSSEHLVVSFSGYEGGVTTQTSLFPDFEETRPELPIGDLTLDSVEFFEAVNSTIGQDYRNETGQEPLPITIFVEPIQSNGGFSFVWRVTFGSVLFGSDSIWQAYFDIESSEVINIEIHSSSP